MTELTTTTTNGRRYAGLTKAQQTALVAEQAAAKAKADAAMMAEIEALRAQNTQLKAEVKAKAESRQGLTIKVGEKGGVCVYGLGRFPVTLYQEQWARLLAPAMVAEITAFIAANQIVLKTKAAQNAAA